MKSTLVCMSLLLTAAFALSGCGSHDSSNNCSENFINDFNTVSESFLTMSTSSDFTNTQSLVDQFSQKYSGVVCKADLSTPSQLDPTPATINANDQVVKWHKALSAVQSQESIDDSTASSD